MKRVVVLSAYLSEAHAHAVLSGIRACAQEHACSVVIFTCKMRYQAGNQHDAGEFMVFDVPDLSKYDGIIIAGSTIYSDTLVQRLVQAARESGKPTVSLERYTKELMNVAIDNRLAMQEIMRHVIVDHGYRRINYVAGVPNNPEAMDRYAAYTEALEAYGIPFEQERVYWGDWLKSTGERAAEAFWASDLPRPEVIVCASDKCALGVHAVLERMGVRVPQDVALTGFDDDQEARYYVPGITSVARKPVMAGYRACEAVLSGMREADRGKLIHIETKMELRESCGCNHPVSVEEKQFRKLYFQQKNRNEKLIGSIDDLSVDLTMVSTFSELKTVLGRHVASLGCEAFYLALFDNILSPDTLDFVHMEAQGEGAVCASGKGRATLVFASENGKEIEGICEDAAAYLRRRTGEDGAQGCYVVNPLHFGEILFGYTMIKNSELPFDSELFYTMTTDIGNAVQAVKSQQMLQMTLKKLEDLWGLDALTGIYNRAGFKRYGERVWKESIERKSNVMLLFADLDGLKRINDTFGHDEGDRYIRAMADIFSNARHHGEVVMRYGGDEFVVIAGNVTEAYARGYVENIQQRIRQYNETSGGGAALSASVGFTLLEPAQDDALEDAICRADREMYQMKKRK